MSRVWGGLDVATGGHPGGPVEKLKPETRPMVSFVSRGNVWNRGESGRVRDWRDVPSVLCPCRGPWGDLPSSDQCIPSRVAQTPGRPSCGPHLRTECGLRGEGPLHTPLLPLDEADPRPGERERVWVSASLGHTTCLGAVLCKCLHLSLSLWLCIQDSVGTSASVSSLSHLAQPSLQG